MSDKLKPLYDAAKAADEKVQQILNDMLAAFGDGGAEGTATAMKMRDDLDAARVAADGANTLYISARDAVAETNDNARKFVPVDEQKPTDKKQVSRAEYEAMDYPRRHDFFKSGGEIIENPAE